MDNIKIDNIKVDCEKKMVLYALNYAKEIILFQHRQSSPGSPFPPLKPITDGIRMLTNGKLPWEE